MVHSFIATIATICFFVHSIETHEGCSKPPSLTNGYFRPEKQFYRINESVYYRCTSRHYLFGKRKLTCLSNGQWDGKTPYCAKGSKNVKLMKNEDEYGVVLDGFTDTCLKDFNLTLDESIYVQVNGVHSRAVVGIFPQPITRNLLFEVFYFNKSFETYRYEDLSSYVKCYGHQFSVIFVCDFRKSLRNPLIRIKIASDFEGSCSICDVCEIDVFVQAETSLRGSNAVVIGALSAGISLIAVLILIVVIFIVLKKKKKKELSSKMQADHREGEENGYEQVNETMRDAPPQMSKVKQRESESVYVNEFPSLSSGKHLSVDKDGYVVQNTASIQRKLEPLYINEFPPISSSNSLLDDEDGYLVPTTVYKKDEPKDLEANIYCSIPEVSPYRQLPIGNTSNLYANV